MEKSNPSRLAELNELLDQLRLSLKINVTISAILAEYESRIYTLEQNYIAIHTAYRTSQDNLSSLEHRYSDLLYRISQLRSK